MLRCLEAAGVQEADEEISKMPMEIDLNGEAAEVAFDAAEDEALIAEGIKKQLKRKGIKPVDSKYAVQPKKQKVAKA